MAPDPIAAPRHPARITALLALGFAGILLCARGAHALRVVDYNLLHYPSIDVSGRNPCFANSNERLVHGYCVMPAGYVAVGPGLYFIRMTAPGISPAAARVAVVH